MSEPVANPGPVDVVRLREGLTASPERACSVCGLTLLRYEVHGCDLARLEAKLDALETLVREIRHALSAGAVGKWGNG